MMLTLLLLAFQRDFSLIVDVIHQEPYNSVSISGQGE